MWKKPWVLALVSSLSAFAIGEAYVRSRGLSWSIDFPNEPTMHAPDPVLGWENKAGEYELPSYTPDLKPFRIRMREGGLRASAARPTRGGRAVVVLGGSYVMGWAIPDEDTFVWKLQRTFPSFSWLNYGTGAYGTYQSLLRLKRHLRAAERPPARVLYGFMGDHDMRNVGDPRWLALLSRLSRRGHVDVPYCRLEADKSLRCYPPKRYPLAFLDRWSSAIMLARGLYYNSRAKTWDRQKTAVTLKLMEEMNALSRENGAEFAVVFLSLDSGRRKYYADALKRLGVAHIDCVDPHMHRPGYKVPGEGHPNGAMNDLWAECIGKDFRARRK